MSSRRKTRKNNLTLEQAQASKKGLGFACNQKPGKDRHLMNRSRILPPTYFYLALLVMLAVHFMFPVLKIIPSPWNAIGVIFLVAGIVLSLMGDGIFRKVGTTIKPYQESTALVTENVFRLSRNPMYLGYVFLLTGLAFLLGSLAPFLVIPLFMVLIEKIFIATEEKMLTEKFGQTYLDYQERVRRWI
jgi:protein-S-isoprenylcysteine O-methyltransferase Ste14